MIFDTVPRWFALKTNGGYSLTPRYTVPPMPWGVNRRDLESLLRRWYPDLTSVVLTSYGLPKRGILGPAADHLHRARLIRELIGTIVHVTI